MIQCKYCNTEFQTIYSLNTHIKKAKYCLAKQGKTDEINEKKFQCELCNKLLSSKQRLENHTKICKEKTLSCEYCNEVVSSKNKLVIHISTCVKKFEFIIEDYKKQLRDQAEQYEIQIKEKSEKYENQIKELQDKLERIATAGVKKPTNQTTNITTINNILAPYKLDVILDRFSKTEITEEHVIDGQSGIARALIPCLINDDGKKMIKCNDASRGVFITIDEYGNVSKDLKARNLALAIEPIATKKANKIIEIYEDKINKFSHTKKLKKDIEYCRKEIEDMKETLQGFKKGEAQYKQYLEKIKIKEMEINRNINLIEEYEQNGIEEDDFNIEPKNLENLNSGRTNIQDVKKDTNNFANTISPPFVN